MTSTLLKAKVTWTYRDYCALPPDRNRYEIIDGDMYVTPAPTTVHQSSSKRIQTALVLQIEENGLGIVFNAPIDVIFGDTRVVQPDIIVIRKDRRGIISTRGIEGAPDLVVEILSPSTADVDRDVKKKLYASEGVREYWLVDEVTNSIEVLELSESGFQTRGTYGPGQRVESGLWEIELEVDRIFAPI